MLAAERELGPRWTPKELQMFYILLRALDVTTSSSSSTASVQWTKLERKLPARTPAMICALFGMHREYLSRPEASVEGFCAIMADYYKAVDEELRSGASSGPIRANAAASPDADIKMEVVEDEPSHSSDHEMDAATRIRKRENSLTPASTAADNANALSMLPSASAFSSATVKTEKKKRKLERILAWEAAGDQLELQAQLQLQIRSDEDETAVVCGVMRSSASSSTPASKPTPSRSCAWLQDPSLARLLPGKKFELPWFHWFYSFVDSDFFSHNEFVDCLHRMGLGNITAAARPVWSSVRACMGRPRRLSPRFFAQEKTKLDNYRTVKRGLGLQYKAPEGWPFRCVAPLSVGATVLVCQENPKRFLYGVVESYAQGDSVCGVKLAQEHGDSVLICSLDAVMVLSSSSSPMKKEDEAEQQQAAASQAQQSSLPSVFQYNRRAGSGVELPGIDTSWPTDESTSTGMLSLHHEEKIGAVLAVKDLLHRKEQLVTALATLNSRVVLEREASGLGAYNENVTNADVSIDTSSWSAAGDRSILQRQYAWIVVNLDVTNRSLQEALVRLQECSGNAQAPSSLGAQSAMSASSVSFAAPTSEPQPMDVDATESTTESLSLQHMKWAVSFLAQSQKSSSDLVASSISQMAPMEASVLSVSSVETGAVLPDTRQLISTCLCLMSVVRRGTSPSNSPNGIPPLITQKLMERLLELLEPRHEANLDLYAELRSAAEGVQTTLRSSSAQRPN